MPRINNKVRQYNNRFLKDYKKHKNRYFVLQQLFFIKPSKKTVFLLFLLFFENVILANELANQKTGDPGETLLKDDKECSYRDITEVLNVVKDHQLTPCNKPKESWLGKDENNKQLVVIGGKFPDCQKQLDGIRDALKNFLGKTEEYRLIQTKKIMQNCGGFNADLGDRILRWMYKHISTSAIKRITDITKFGNCDENVELVFADMDASTDLSLKGLSRGKLMFEKIGHVVGIIFPQTISEQTFSWKSGGITSLSKLYPGALLFDYYNFIAMPVADILDPEKFKKYISKRNENRENLAVDNFKYIQRIYLEGAVSVEVYSYPTEQCAQKGLKEFEEKISQIKL